MLDDSASLSLYLAAAGIGKIRIVDHNRVVLSNLNRQIKLVSAEHAKQKRNIARSSRKKFTAIRHTAEQIVRGIHWVNNIY